MMKVIAIQSSPNVDGLTCQLAKAVLEGAENGDAQIELVHLNQLNIKPCMAHNRGWGMCREAGKCVLQDDFQSLREKISQADALVFSTPVYFGDISESAKRFFDRWRRCENFNRESSILKGKPVIGISAAGGSGGGAVNSLRNLETYMRRLQLRIFDLVPVTRISKNHKLEMLRTAGKRIIS